MDENTKIVYLKTHAQWPTSARDQAMIAQRSVLENGGGLIVSKSVGLDEFGETKGCVRAHVEVGCFEVVATEKGTRVTAIVEMDPNGYIPKVALMRLMKVGLPAAYEEFISLVPKEGKEVKEKVGEKERSVTGKSGKDVESLIEALRVRVGRQAKLSSVTLLLVLYLCFRLLQRRS